MRFNPPPNWPPSPPGWAPDPGWKPDPAWPPPPPGWQFWVDDGVPFPPQQPARKRAKIWLGAAALAAVVILAAGSVWFIGANQATDGSKKPDITTLTKDLLVPRSGFPDFDGNNFKDGLEDAAGSGSGTHGEVTITPEECAQLVGAPRSASQIAGATLSSRGGAQGIRSIGVRLAVGPDRQNLADFVSKCSTFTVSMGSGTGIPDMETELRPLDLAGMPAWAVGYATESTPSAPLEIPVSTATTMSTIAGYYRGVLVHATYVEVSFGSHGNGAADPEVTGKLVALFNTQVDQLEAAP